jgi:hypothetical protein
VLTREPPLKARQRARNPRAYFVPNGVAMDWHPAVKGAEARGGTAEDGRLRGTLNRNVDFELPARDGARLPDSPLRIVLRRLEAHAGPAGALETLKGLPNVRCSGSVPPGALRPHRKV